MDGWKKCTGCSEVKPLAAFHRSNKTKDGRVQRCAQCARAAYAAKPPLEAAMDGDRTCWDCGETKHITEFPRHKRAPGGRHQLCKSCHSRRERQRRLDNPEVFLERKRTIGKSWELQRYYGITLQQYADMVEEQGGGCAICGATAEQNGRFLSVDHDHSCCPSRKRSCGQCIRGLLCSNCNRAIGWLRDDPDLAEKAAAYLRRT